MTVGPYVKAIDAWSRHYNLSYFVTTPLNIEFELSGWNVLATSNLISVWPSYTVFTRAVTMGVDVFFQGLHAKDDTERVMLLYYSNDEEGFDCK